MSKYKSQLNTFLGVRHLIKVLDEKGKWLKSTAAPATVCRLKIKTGFNHEPLQIHWKVHFLGRKVLINLQARRPA